MNQCYSRSSDPFPLKVGNRITSPAIELALGLYDEGFNGGVPSCALVTVLALSVLITLSGDEALELTSGDTHGVM